MTTIKQASIFDTPADVIIIPVSTAGTLSSSFQEALAGESIPVTVEGRAFSLGSIFWEQLPAGKKFQFICYACSVDNHNSSYAAIRKIARNLLSTLAEHPGVHTVAAPVLGSGAGHLNSYKSFEIFAKAFEEAGLELDLVVCSPDPSILNSLPRSPWDPATSSPSSTIVFGEELEKIHTDPVIQQIISSKEFYYELATSKFSEFRSFLPEETIFFRKLREKFVNSGVVFSKFLPMLDQSGDEYKFTLLCGELISYIDHNAYFKNIWNKYPDKRVLAKSMVRQTVWFKSLLKLREAKLDLNVIKPGNVRNALLYLFNPGGSITILSEKHRALVFETMIGSKYSGPESIRVLFSFFQKFSLLAFNAQNNGALYTRILYLPYIREIWLDEPAGDESGVPINTGEREIDIEYVTSLILDNLSSKSLSLDLGNCGLTELADIPELFECEHLEELILSNEWPVYDGGWQKIKSRNKGPKNNLSSLPPELNQLTNLKRLLCGGDWNDGKSAWNRWGIKSLGPIPALQNLEYLNLSNNQLAGIDRLENLTKLQTLHLNNNDIQQCTSLSNLTSLAEVNLSNNRISDVLPLRNLNQLQTVDLHRNQIKDIRALESVIARIGVANVKWRKDTVNIAQNSLEVPPMEFVAQGKDAVLRYLEEIRSGDTYVNSDIKVILVGNSEAGKSTLVKYLDGEQGLDKPHAATHWMSEKVVQSKYPLRQVGDKCTLHLFDFGGHDYYHDTHHIFFGANTVYLLLWEERTNKVQTRSAEQTNFKGDKVLITTRDFPVGYWLDSVKHFIKDVEPDNFKFKTQRAKTYNSQVMLLQNKVADASGIAPLDNRKLKSSYPFVFDFLNISIIEPRRNLAHFDDAFTEILNSMEIIGALLPRYYQTIKNAIADYTGAAILTMEEFLVYCNNLLVVPLGMGQCGRLTRYLEQIGIILCSESSPVKVYIRKGWVIETIHTILEGLINLKGDFTFSYIEDKMQGDKHLVSGIIDIMIDFRMIFRHPLNPNRFIAPLYLPAMPDSTVLLFLNKRLMPYRRIEYAGFIQKNVILTLFSSFTLQFLKSGEDGSSNYHYWRDGLILKQPTSEEIVMLKFELGSAEGRSRIDIFEITPKTTGFIDEVIITIKNANQGYDTDEMVTLDGKDYISLAVLQANADDGRLVFMEKTLADTKSTTLPKLFWLKDYEKFVVGGIKKKKVVFSYSKDNLSQVRILQSYLQPLIADGLIDDPWYCSRLEAGETWESVIRQKFDEADLVFFLVSSDMFDTKYITEQEIPFAISRYQKDKSVKIIPVVLEPYDWERKDNNLKVFSAMPYQARPISQFRDPKLAWHSITLSVKMMLKNDADPGNKKAFDKELFDIYERQVAGKLDVHA